MVEEGDMKDWERDAWVSFASAALTAASHHSFRPLLIAEHSDAVRFAEELAKLGTESVTAVIPNDGEYKVRQIAPNVAGMTKHCAELADAMLAQLRERVTPR